jgi:hypothetical protein
LTARAALNDATLKSRTSIIGSASESCRRTKTMPIATPARMKATGSHPAPFAAISFRP